MDRTLRVLAIITLLCLGFVFLLFQLPLDTETGGSGIPDGLERLLPVLPTLLVNLVGKTTSALCLSVGVATLIACIQRQQRWWTVGFVVLLIVAVNGPYLILELTALLDSQPFWTYTLAPIMALLLEAVVPLAVLVYTITPHPRTPTATRPIQPVPGFD